MLLGPHLKLNIVKLTLSSYFFHFFHSFLAYLYQPSSPFSVSPVPLSDEQLQQIVGGASITLDPLAASWWPENSDDFAEIDVVISGGLSNSHVDFSLSNVSSWEGYCMNAGSQSDSDKDLKLNVSDQDTVNPTLIWSGGGQTIKASWTGAAPGSFTVKVRSYDYGAYGDLTATLYGQATSNTVNIPRDDNGNGIADGWNNDSSNNYDEEADDETGPSGNNHNGDGFSVFEEYRGFMVKENHTRTKPSEKDLFVYSSCAEGYGYASNLANPPFKSRLVNWSDMGGNARVMNSKAGQNFPGHSDQKALKVLKDDITPATEVADYGQTKARPKTLGRPNEVGDIVIFYRKIRPDTPTHIDETTSDTADPDARKKVIGHEIGHGIKVNHHVGGGPCIMEGWVGIMNQGTQYASHPDGDHEQEFKLR